MKKKKFRFPDFDKMSYEEEANWWDKHDWGEFWDELEDVKIVVDLHKPKEETLILRLQKGIKDKLEKSAKSKGVSVSSLARLWLTQRLQSSH